MVPDKSLCQNRQLQKYQKSSKKTKIGILSLDSRLTRALRQTFDVCRKIAMISCYHENFIKKYWKLSQICSKNLENRTFLFTPRREEVTLQLPGAARALKFFLKLANRILPPRSENHMHIKCRLFSRKIFATDAINRLLICYILDILSNFNRSQPL